MHCELIIAVILMPCPSTDLKMFWAGPNFFARARAIVTVPNFLCQTKRWFAFGKFSFCAVTKSFGAELNVIQFWVWTKTLMPCPFTGPKTFWAGSNFWCHTKH